MIKHHPKPAIASLKGHHMSKIWHVGLRFPTSTRALGEIGKLLVLHRGRS
jgi:hypothetical protein